jgi:hypothetical protein
MKTKSLLIAAATLAAGIISSQAAVYSQNVVGYVNVPLPANKFTMCANQLVTGTDVAKTNCNIQAVLGTSGWTSDFNGINNTTVYVWDNPSHNWLNYYYYIAADADNQFGSNVGDGWYDGTGTFSSATLPPGAGYFIKDYSGLTKTNTLVGTVITGTNVYTIHQGFTTFSYIQPVSTNLNSSIVGLIGDSDFNGLNNTAYYHWNGVNNWDTFYYYIAADADNQFGSNSGDGWYSGDGSIFLATAPQYWPKVGEGFFIHQINATSLQYTNSFTIQ